MNTTVQILGAILVIVTVIGTAQAWRDGRKWRQRRIAHVFGKRDGPDSNLQMPALDGEESDMRAGMSDIGLSPLSNGNSDILRNYLLSRNDQFSPLDEGEKSQDDYDKYPTDADHIPQRVIDRYVSSITTKPILSDQTAS